ncbi:MAG: DUF5395 family protein [Thermodesulfobacteriota bacterium]|nr:DUF5395 family protein [Thermodesulfobacteriota bacterium]
MIDLIVRHSGNKWVATGGEFYAEASTLGKLDKELEKIVRQKGYLEVSKKIYFFMGFDNSVLPEWIRQYSQHYFNRILCIENDLNP